MVSLRGRAKSLRARLERLTTRSSSSFKFAFLFLRPEQRRALEQVYAFCRIVDDIVDERPPGPDGDAQAASSLAEWRDEVAALYGHGSPRTELGADLCAQQVSEGR